MHYSSEKFYVVDVVGPAVVGLPTCRTLMLVDINVDAMTSSSPQDQPNVKAVQSPSSSVIQVTPPEGAKTRSIEQLKQWFPDYFDWIGCFKGEDELHLKPDAKPYIDAPRRCPIHLRDKIKSELDKMEELGIIRKIDKHTDWCSSLTYATKRDGSLRICLDPQRLNQALKRCPHKIPTVEEITPRLSNAKYFTKLDAKAGYWSVRLAPESQELTTFRTPFGRYCFQRIAFGLNVSQDLYQQHMDRIIEQCEGCIGISDDVTIYRSSEAEHDRRLIAFFKVARKEGLMLNSAKCIIKTNRISFFGRVYTENGVLPDPAKVEDILQMQMPQSADDIKWFVGWMDG